MTIYQNTIAGSGFLQGPTGATGPAANTNITVYEYVATAGQTTFTGVDSNLQTLAYTPTGIFVTLNGSVLNDTTDFTATNGTDVVLTQAANVNDELNIYTFPAFSVSNTYTQVQANDLFAAKAGSTLTGNFENTSNGYFQVPIGTTAQRPAANTAGYLRYNTELSSFEGANGSVWGAIGGSSGGGSSALGGVINTNANTIASSITMTTSGQSVGPVTVADGAAVTMSQGTRWVVF